MVISRWQFLSPSLIPREARSPQRFRGVGCLFQFFVLSPKFLYLSINKKFAIKN